jgi:hypothetical protein
VSGSDVVVVERFIVLGPMPKNQPLDRPFYYIGKVLGGYRRTTLVQNSPTVSPVTFFVVS